MVNYITFTTFLLSTFLTVALCLSKLSEPDRISRDTSTGAFISHPPTSIRKRDHEVWHLYCAQSYDQAPGVEEVTRLAITIRGLQTGKYCTQDYDAVNPNACWIIANEYNARATMCGPYNQGYMCESMADVVDWVASVCNVDGKAAGRVKLGLRNGKYVMMYVTASTNRGFNSLEKRREGISSRRLDKLMGFK